MAADLLQELWIPQIQEQLWENNAFMAYSVDHGGYVNNRVVHVPQSATTDSRDILVNPTLLPIPVSQREDADLTYTIDQYATPTKLVTNFEEQQISYPKRDSLLRQMGSALNDRVARELLVKWCPTDSARVFATTGSGDTTNAPIGASGSRKKVTLDDIKQLAKRLNDDLVPESGRYALMPSSMYYDLFNISDVTNMSAFRGFNPGAEVLPNGVVDRLFGLNIILKPTTVITDSSGNVKEYTAAVTSTDCSAVIAWQENFVARAPGAIQLFYEPQKAGYLGDIFNYALFFGGTKLRNDERGVAMLYQGQ